MLPLLVSASPRRVQGVSGAPSPRVPPQNPARGRARAPVSLLWRSLQPRARPHGDCRLHSNLIHSHSDILSRVLASSPWRRSASPKLGTQRDIDDLRCLCVQVITMSGGTLPGAPDVTTEQLQQILQSVQAELERRAALQRGAPESKRNSILCASGKALPSEAEVHAWALLVLLHGRGADGSWVAVPTLVDQWMNVVLLQSSRYKQLRERWQPPTDDPAWRNLALAKGLVPSLLSQAAARAAEPLAHITRTLVQLEVIDHDVGQTALSNYLKNCLAKSKGISGPSYNPANGSHTLHRHIAAAVPVASLLKVRGKELLSALHRTREEPEAAPSYAELQASADASAAAARREQQRSSQLRAQVKTLQEVSVNAVRKDAEREAKEKADATT
ncbi:hypothetical protein EMIHUDRAFT_438136 [Emiliania huxleyi CCMP1516]|uniref:Uncharacterized protein n=2 Tax=Emiliania huxleyi TaxID=2903 RepID=A0A0D3IDI3_EMIH1|nr:hypothetical protein EMIHUDRAFT_438136 [Emiliania huxleyi CCMP1516]EOD09318.1 hypothetical protein EMIHUDRAFT_438136 [Emiliania huxleyi CCMP1516]|eukprot:XP_005761747.1 hypothetical protein EMIHUDRAFT_438136 [Emiliania huxleyi CCMP1516]